MKTNLSYRIIALTMALLVFSTSVGFSIDMHFCQGQLKSTSIFGKAKNCHEMAKMAICPHHQKKMEAMDDESCKEDQKDCCNSKTILVQSDDDKQFQNSNLSLTNNQQQFLFAYVESFHFNQPIIATYSENEYYKPPLIQRNLPVLFQSFLI